MLILTVGFSSLSLLLGINFFRKYANRLSHYSHGKHLARVADYQGRPICMRFDYPLDGGLHWESVVTEVDEIFHYGPDYFLRGKSSVSKSTRLYKLNNMTKINFDAQGSEIEILQRLLSMSPEVRVKNQSVKPHYKPLALFLKGSQPGPVGNLIRSTIHGSESKAA